MKVKVIDISQLEQFRKSKYNTWGSFHLVKTYFLLEDLINFIEKRGKMVEVGDKYV